MLTLFHLRYKLPLAKIVYTHLRGRISHTVTNKSLKQLKDEPNVSNVALLSLTMANILKTVLSLRADNIRKGAT